MKINKIITRLPSWLIGLTLLSIFILFCLSYRNEKPFKIANIEFGFFGEKGRSQLSAKKIKEILIEIGFSSDEIKNIREALKLNEESISKIDNKINSLEEHLSNDLMKNIFENKKNIHIAIDSLRNEESISKIDNKINSLEEHLSNDLMKNIFENKKNIHIAIDSLRQEILTKIDECKGNSFHIQGVFLLSKRLYTQALLSFTDALLLQIGTEDHLNSQRNKENILRCLKKVKSNEIKNDFLLNKKLEMLLEKAKEYNYGGLHEDFIYILIEKLNADSGENCHLFRK